MLFKNFYPNLVKKYFEPMASKIYKITQGDPFRLIYVGGGGRRIAPAFEAALANQDSDWIWKTYTLNQLKDFEREHRIGVGYRPIIGVTNGKNITTISDVEIFPAKFNVLADDDSHLGQSISGSVPFVLENFDGVTITVIYKDMLGVANVYGKSRYLTHLIPPNMRIRSSERLKRFLKRNRPFTYAELEEKGALDKLVNVDSIPFYSYAPLFLKGWASYIAGNTNPISYEEHLDEIKRIIKKFEKWQL